MNGDAGILTVIWPWLLILGLMYLLFIRPQQKRDRERREMLEAMRVGDRVVTIGGIYGIITALRERNLELEVAEDVTLTMSREAVAGPQPELGEEIETDQQ